MSRGFPYHSPIFFDPPYIGSVSQPSYHHPYRSVYQTAEELLDFYDAKFRTMGNREPRIVGIEYNYHGDRLRIFESHQSESLIGFHEAFPPPSPMMSTGYGSELIGGPNYGGDNSYRHQNGMHAPAKRYNHNSNSMQASGNHRGLREANSGTSSREGRKTRTTTDANQNGKMNQNGGDKMKDTRANGAGGNASSNDLRGSKDSAGQERRGYGF